MQMRRYLGMEPAKGETRKDEKLFQKEVTLLDLPYEHVYEYRRNNPLYLPSMIVVRLGIHPSFS